MDTIVNRRRNLRFVPTRRRREGGAALVEFAMVLPLLVALLFGIVEFGIALNDYQSIRHGVREGARQAVVKEYAGASSSCISQPTWPEDVRRVVCLTKDRVGLGNGVRVRVQYGGVGSPGSGNHGWVSVCAQRNVDPITGVIPAIDGISLKSGIRMRMEKPMSVPVGVYAEAAPSGGSWSGC